MKTFILAGGFATRLWPLTEKRAKPLLPIAGKPLLTHLTEGIPRTLPITVSTNAAFAEGFQAWALSIGRPVELVIEGTRADDHKLGALGAIAAWVVDRNVDDDLLILTGDNYLGFSLAQFLKCFHGHPLLAAHDIGDLAKASQFGTVILDANQAEDSRSHRVAAFEEKPREPKTTLVSAGCAVLPRHTLPILIDHAKTHPDNMGGIFEELLHRGEAVECFPFTEPWMDIGSFASYLDAHRTLVGDRTILGPRSTDAGCHYDGSVSIGQDCRLERSDFADCLIFDRCHITDCSLRRCVVDEGCVLKGVDLQDQMLRAGTKIEVE